MNQCANESATRRLAGRVLVAHNARFDYGFLKQEFERAGLAYRARTLCTVKLSRRLYPEHARHNLDSLIERHGLECRARHRAMGDAEAVWQFLRVAQAERGDEMLAVAARPGGEAADRCPRTSTAPWWTRFPTRPRVPVVREGAAPLYVGKSIAMRTRVLQHFGDDVRSAKQMQLAREVRRIDWQRTAGELGALLREAQLVKELLPVFNRQLRRPVELCGFALDAQKLRLVQDFAADSVPLVHGLFRSKRAALERCAASPTRMGFACSAGIRTRAQRRVLPHQSVLRRAVRRKEARRHTTGASPRRSPR